MAFKLFMGYMWDRTDRFIYLPPDATSFAAGEVVREGPKIELP